ncbi:MAG TPA: SDR family NAD(P)-dependent oxidoreductase [Stellaceae bacterium]|nr:SDR family NAD(P)-dependent oxidoreductase [Stellaceae bacterium]
MRELRGKAAFVTGGASGIGLALGRAFAASGMKVMLADIEAAALEAAVRGLAAAGAQVKGVVCDVSERAAVDRAAAETIAAFGKVHVVCNNAGVGGGGGPVEQIPPSDWDWTIGVNLLGVIHGIAAFLPHIKTHGEGGHIVNTASMAGMVSPPLMAPYNVTKFAVVTLSETLAAELADSTIGVSVLCPGWVDTRIVESARNRPARFGPPREPSALARERAQQVAALLRSGMSPDEVAERVLRAIRDNDLHIFTHPEMRGALEDRFRRILAAYDKTAAFKR